MKKLILIALAFVAIQATAQEKKKELRKEEHKERVHKFQDLTPEEAATLQTKKMVLHLDLTKDQQDKIYKIQLENAKERKAKMEEHKAMKENNPEGKLTKEAHLKRTNERLDHEIAMKEKMKNILNEEQYTKWSEKMEQKQKKHGPNKKY